MVINKETTDQGTVNKIREMPSPNQDIYITSLHQCTVVDDYKETVSSKHIRETVMTHTRPMKAQVRPVSVWRQELGRGPS